MQIPISVISVRNFSLAEPVSGHQMELEVVVLIFHDIQLHINKSTDDN